MTEEQFEKLLAHLAHIGESLETLSNSTWELNANIELLMGSGDGDRNFLRTLDIGREG